MFNLKLTTPWGLVLLIAIVATGFTASWRSMTGGKTETIKVPA